MTGQTVVNENDGGGRQGKRMTWLRIRDVGLYIGTIGTLVALVLAFYHQSELSEIAMSMSTSYDAEFPKNMDAIIDLIDSVPNGGELLMASDFVGYGMYSNPSGYIKLKHAIENRQCTDRRLSTIRWIVYDSTKREIRRRKQLDYPWDSIKESTTFSAFYRFHAVDTADWPGDTSAFHADLTRREMVDEVHFDSLSHVNLHRISNSDPDLPVFFWIDRTRGRAIFSFTVIDLGAAELSFQTRDSKIIDVLIDKFKEIDTTLIR